MIPILYNPYTTDFTNNGVGPLSDCTKCTVAEERNGSFELQLQYPVTGLLFKELQLTAVVKAVPSRNQEPDLFRIYKISTPFKGIVTVYAQHISYRQSLIPVKPMTASGVQNALNGLKENAAEECPFEFYTDKVTDGDFKVKVPTSMRSLLGGTSGSILDVFGGEYEFKGYQVNLWKARGRNRGVSIRYGKNLIDLQQEKNIQNTITGIYPYWTDGEKLVELPESVLRSANANNFPFPRTITKDFSSEFNEAPTEEQLRAVTQKYIKSNNIGVPKVSLKVSFVDLAQTEDYKGMSMLEDVQLCDTVTVEFEKLGVNVTAKVIKTVYDVLKEKYDNIELGEPKTNLSTTIKEQEAQTQEKLDAESSARQKAVKKLAEDLATSSGLFMTEEKQTDGSIYYCHNKEQMGDSNIIWKITAEAIGISTDGGKTYPYGLTASGTAILDRIYAIGIDGEYITAKTIKADKMSIDDLKALGATIAGWEIKEAISKDIVDPNDKNTVYRVGIRPPTVSNPDKTWIVSCQKSTDAGKVFEPNFVLYSDGTAHFGKYIRMSPNGEFYIQTDDGEIYINRYGIHVYNEDGTSNSLSSSGVVIQSGRVQVSTGEGDNVVIMPGIVYTQSDTVRCIILPKGVEIYNADGDVIGRMTVLEDGTCCVKADSLIAENGVTGEFKTANGENIVVVGGIITKMTND